MQSSQDNLQDLKKCTVAIQRSGDGKLLGTGIIVTDDGLILTCYHVIGNIKTKTIDYKAVDIYFPSNHNSKGHANVLEKHSDALSDIAFLQLQGKLPVHLAVANLSESVYAGHNFRSFGFRKETTFDGLYADGTIQGKIQRKFKGADNNFSLQEVIQLKSDGIDHGMSGAAVLDTHINRVIGIVSEYLATSSNVDRNLALAMPIESITQIYPELKQKNPGLRIKEFLRKVGIDIDNIWYQRIEELYVAPVEYDEIKNALKNYRFVFITGTKEYGKTYTAIRLLFEYYKEGYQPKYVRLDEGQEESGMVGKKMSELIEMELKPKSIIYFEDPFGQTKYHSARILESEIGTIIDAVRNSTDTYVIITSREEIFKEFKRRTVAEKLEKFKRGLYIKRPSYNYEKRKEMLIKYAQIKNCK